MTDSASRPVWQVYLGSTIFLFPAFLAWAYCNVLLAPALEEAWSKFGAANAHTVSMFEFWKVFVGNGRLIIVLIGVALLLLELFVSSWPRYRAGVMMSFVFLLNSLVLLGLVDFCTLTCLVARSTR